MINTNDIFSIIVFFISLIVALICINYYQKTRITEFLIFAFFFLLAVSFSISVTLHLFLDGFFFENNISIQPANRLSYNIIYFISSIIVPLNHVVLVEFWHRAIRSRKSSLINWYSRLVILITTVLYFPLIYENQFYVELSFEGIKLIRAIVYFTAVLGMGMIYIELRKALDKTEFRIENPEISKFYRFWKISITIVYLFVLAWLFKIVFHVFDFINEEPIVATDELYSVALIVATLAYFIVWYIALRHPQGLLIFEYQIVQAFKMYSMIEKSGSADTSVRIERIFDYLKAVQVQFEEELEGT